MNLHDVIEINANTNDAAIVLDQGLTNASLVGNYMPTRASLKVFEHLAKAVSPSATQEQRAINIYGSYGSGKSHLAVVIAHLLKFGASSEGFESLLSKFSNSKNERLANNLKNTFLSDSDAKPYLLISLYGSKTTSIGSKLLEGLYDAVEREETLETSKVLPKTEFDACRERLQTVIESKPEILESDLDEYGITEYLDIESLLIGLENHETEAINCFLEWHKKEFVGLDFNISNHGGKNFIEAYKEAGKNLYKNHNFAGIVVLWDEFGHAIEDLIKSPYRNSGEEIIQLQQFVETVCSSDFGHTIFIGVTHVSFEEYGERTNADNVVKDGLAKISGRFNTPFKVELSASENEGYHLLGMQKTWTKKGNELASSSQNNKDTLITSCFNLSMFDSLRDELNNIVIDIYPLHPTLAVGLFNLAQIAAQANRTALTFFRDNASEILNTQLYNESLWGSELIRLPKIIDFYGDRFKSSDTKAYKIFEKAQASIIGDSKEETERKKDILKLILLSNFLGESFQTSESYLSSVLYDCEPTSHKSKLLFTDLEWLKSANLIWKNVATEHWKLSGEGGVSIEDVVKEALDDYTHLSLKEILNNQEKIRTEFFPMLGFGNFEPSKKSGIIRSFIVSTSLSLNVNSNSSVSTFIHMLLANTAVEANELLEKIKAQDSKDVYYWLPVQGVDEVKLKVEGHDKSIKELLHEYLAVDSLLNGKTLPEAIRSQLIAKVELLSRSINKIVSLLFGKLGFTNNSSLVIKSGDTDPVSNITSWHELKKYLEHNCHKLYSKDIPVRYMKMNYLLKNKDIGNEHPNAPVIATVTQRILDFSSHPTYQTEFLGEERETSSESGVINGILGRYANDLFIERPELDFKSIDELNGNIQEILTLIRKKIMKRRDKPFDISSIEKDLTCAPYGIPSCVIPILIALAIRTEQNKVTFLHKEKNDGTALARCFMNSKPIRSRVVEFTTKQVSILSLYGQVLRELGLEGGELRVNYLPEQALAEGFTKKIKQWFNELSQSTFNSKHLSDGAKNIAKSFVSIGVTNQDLAEKTAEILDIKGNFLSDNVDSYIESLVAFCKEFSLLENIKKQNLLDCWQQNVPSDSNDITKIIHYLTQIKEPSNKVLIDLLEKVKDSKIISAEEILTIKYSLTIDECTDNQISELSTFIEFSIKNGLNFIGNKEKKEDDTVIFISRIESLIAHVKPKKETELNKVLTYLKQSDNKSSNILIDIMESKSDFIYDLDSLVEPLVNKKFIETSESDKDEIVYRLRSLLSNAIYSSRDQGKPKTPELIEQDINKIFETSSISRGQKLLILSKIMLNMQSDEQNK
jgi:hypothetical protein